ncbi:hypothetical protein [Streptomyces sp. HUAS TT20]|uniref:hypothetical protein n=1 Tax=Streptomyces sp. HUAS TT20 TaxID=3447509 RepID=UPI0021D9AFBC|nr:hypothetical protein [Streptomyces sp. HUAS 15-9]UXY31880.1 hypothetical protein N8I87_38605 [Streptomyces sp. HUAS 15-9]
MRRASLACAVAGVLALTAACGTTDEAHEKRGRTLTAAELDLLTRSGTFVRTSTGLANKESELIAACMVKKGFRYRADKTARPTGSDEQQTLNMRDRRSRGYGLGDQYASGSDGRGSSPNDAYVASLSEKESAAYMKAMRGGGSDFREMRFGRDQKVTFSARGCEAESRRHLYGSLDDWVSVAYYPQNLNGSLTTSVEESPKYRKAMTDWKTCMRAEGYRYGSPDDAYERLRAAYHKQGATQALRRREVSVAVADGKCAAKLHIPSLVLTLRRSYAQSLPDDDKVRLQYLTSVWQAAADRAR